MLAGFDRGAHRILGVASGSRFCWRRDLSSLREDKDPALNCRIVAADPWKGNQAYEIGKWKELRRGRVFG